ncbi:MAG: BamA/TamA family outer membrane protein [Elusimicrobia bacterium]|nr:BamA/TamA family outer membrane protein [Elusimicrobiota bacterium]
MRGLARALPLLLFLAAAVRAQQTPPAAPHQDPELVPAQGKVPPELARPTEKAPWIVRWMVHPRHRGMFINLPIIDTDPNRGITVGVLPILVVPAQNSDRIEHIHAPSFTYNKNFKFIPTYRYYYYPDETSSLVVRGSASVLAEKEALLMYQNKYLFATDIDFYFRGQWNVDGSNRFFGFGPNSLKDNESDYTEDNIGYDLAVGLPLVSEESHWRARLLNHFMGEKFYAGKINSVANITDRFPGLVARHRQTVNETRAALEYDTRDNSVTTSKGAYLNAFAGWSVDGFSSAFDYTRYGLDARYFYKWPGRPHMTTAGQVKYDQVLGVAPFWLQSHVGGKYSLRAYGDGRFTDRGALFGQLEQRFIFHQEKLSGVTTDFELAPFVGLGEVFDNPKVATARYARPVFGAAVRAVARPQVVGSVDFGVGQEGLAVFMDINYSF